MPDLQGRPVQHDQREILTMATKRKPVRFSDVHENAEVETRDFAIEGGRSAPGRSTVVILCPYCNAHVTAYLWSLAGGGKRCECGALFGSTGNAYQWREPTGVPSPA